MALVYNPVTGQLEDNGLPTVGTRLLQPANDLGTIIRGGLQGVGNTAGALVTAPLDAARRGLTSLVGGDPNSLGTPLSDTAFGLAEQGFADAGAAASRFGQGLQGTALNLLGAQPAAPVSQLAAPAAPTVPAQATAAAPPVDPQVAAATPQSAALTEEDLVGVNAGIAAALAQAGPQGGLMPATGNSFNAQNTVPPQARTAGINFGFGVNGAPTATQVLANYAQQDRQARLDQRVEADRLNQAALASRLNDPFTDTQEKKLILAQMNLAARGSEQAAGLATQNAGAVLGATAQATNAQAALENQRLIAQERNQTALQAAQLTGGYGLQAAQLKAAATQATAAAGAGKNRLANAQADLAETQLNAARAAQEAQLVDPVGLVGLVKNGQVPVSPQDKDPLTGVTLTPELQALQQQILQLQLQQGLLRQQQR